MKIKKLKIVRHQHLMPLIVFKATRHSKLDSANQIDPDSSENQ